VITVAFITRATLFTVPGGDTRQVTHTAAALAAYGVTVDVLLTDQPISYERYELLHFFNIARPADILYHVRRCSVPFVVSPIFVDYSEYDQTHRGGVAGLLFRILGADAIEYTKAVARWLAGRDRLMYKKYLANGHRRSVQEIIRKCSLLLPNSASEYRRLVNAYGTEKPYIVITNGIDGDRFRYRGEDGRDPLLVLCVARIEGIKNQLNLIRALNHTKYNLVLAGAAAPGQPGYFRACHELAATNIFFMGQLSQEELVLYYKKATVHILPSWFETTGLSSLEAAAMGCRIVISDRGDAHEYFGEDAFYCDPSSPESILGAVEAAALAPVSDTLRKKIAVKHTWQEAARQTAGAYQSIMVKQA